MKAIAKGGSGPEDIPVPYSNGISVPNSGLTSKLEHASAPAVGKKIGQGYDPPT